MALAEYGNALNIDTDGSGNPILIDPDSGDTIATYDRASGAWQVTTIEATSGDFGSVNTGSLIPDTAGNPKQINYQDLSDGFGDLLSASVSGLSGNVISIRFSVRPQGTGFDNVFLRINSDSTTNYNYDSTTGATEWRVCSINNTNPTFCHVVIIRNDFNNSVDIEPQYWSIATSPNGLTTFSGKFASKIPSVTEFELFTESENAGLSGIVEQVTL